MAARSSSAIFGYAADLWHEMKTEYDAALEAHYYQAEEATNGNLVRHASRAAGVRALSLFSGPVEKAYKHASEELLEFWQHHPRPTLQDFEQQWLSGRVNAY